MPIEPAHDLPVATSPDQSSPAVAEVATEATGTPAASFPWLELLLSDLGAKNVTRIVETWAENSRRARERETTIAWMRHGLVVIIIVLAASLQACDKLNEGIIGLLSLVVGYIIGRQDAK